MSNSQASIKYEPVSPKSEPEPKPPIRHPKWTEGDVTLRTNDGVEFSVASYHLQSWSVALREVIGCGSQALDLAYASYTLEQFLDIVETGKFGVSGNASVLVQVSALARFLAAHRCPLATELFVKHVRSHTDWSPIVFFLVGVHLDRPQLCAEILDAYPRPEDMFWLCPAPESAVLKPSEIPFDVFAQIPHTYLWALRLTLTGVEKLKVEGFERPMGAGERFLHYMDLSRK